MMPTNPSSSFWYMAWVRTSTCEGSTVMWGWLWYLQAPDSTPWLTPCQCSAVMREGRQHSLASPAASAPLRCRGWLWHLKARKLMAGLLAGSRPLGQLTGWAGLSKQHIHLAGQHCNAGLAMVPAGSTLAYFFALA